MRFGNAQETVARVRFYQGWSPSCWRHTNVGRFGATRWLCGFAAGVTKTHWQGCTQQSSDAATLPLCETAARGRHIVTASWKVVVQCFSMFFSLAPRLHCAELRKFNTSLLLHLKNFPVGHWFLIAGSNCSKLSPQRGPGTTYSSLRGLGLHGFGIWKYLKDDAGHVMNLAGRPWPVIAAKP
jgi:hypothetical protein